MNVIGLLSWYDEPPNWLSAAVTGFARFCDGIIAVDGAYALYPKGDARSHPNQVEAIQLAAEAADVACLVYQPSEPWGGNELEKRQASLDLAKSLAADWVVVFDADYHVQTCNRDSIRWDLANTEHDVATYELLDTIGSPHTSWTSHTRDVFRCTPSLKIGPTHAHYSNETGWLKGPGVELEESLPLNLVARHRSQDRTDARRSAQERYYQLRQMTGIEDLETVSG